MRNFSFSVFFVFLFSFFSVNAQNWEQLGDDIDGKVSGDFFGSSVSFNAEGNRVAVGADQNNINSIEQIGKVQVYELNNENWVQLGQDINGEAKNDLFGSAVSFNEEGNRVAIGGQFNDGNGVGSGHVRVYELQNGNWIQLGQDIDGEAAGDFSGISLDLNSNGNRLAIGAGGNSGNTGHVKVFELQNGSWAQLGQNMDGEASGDFSGISVSFNGVGNRVAIGAQENDGNGNDSGHVRVYALNDDSWVQLGQDINGENADDFSGSSISFNDTGNRLAIGAKGNDGNGTNSGHVRIYELQNNTWEQLGFDIDGEQPYDFQFLSVSFNAQGDKVAIGAELNNGNGMWSGHTRVYGLDDNSNWIQIGEDIDGEFANDRSGNSISFNAEGNLLAIGASGNNANGAGTGHVRIFEFNNENASTEITLNTSGALLITDISGENNDNFELSTSNGNFRIKNSAAVFSTDIPEVVSIDANTVEIPLSLFSNGLAFFGESGDNTMTLGPELQLGPGQFLVLNDFETIVAESANLELWGLTVINGSYDIGGAVTTLEAGIADFSNSVLKGLGTIDGPVQMLESSTMEPGTSPGIINTGNLVFENGASFDAEINGQFPGTDHDQIIVTGTVVINDARLNLIGGYDNAPTNVIVLIENDGGDPVSGTFADFGEGAAVNFGEFSGIISYVGGDGNDVVLLGNTITQPSNLVITEIMYDVIGGDGDWEWIEVYNSGTEETIDLSGYVLDDNSASGALKASNIASGTLEPGQSAVLFDVDGVSEEEFRNIWGTVDLIPVTKWSSLGNNGGDSIGIWNSFESYDDDNRDQLQTIEQVTYKNGEEGWPGIVSGASIFLKDLTSDNTDGTNWALSATDVETPLYDSYRAEVRPPNSGSDIGSPGTPTGTIDTEAPVLVATSPADDATGIAIDAMLTATFSEPVQWQADVPPSIFINDLTTNEPFDSFDPGDPEVVFNGNDLIVNPNTDFEQGHEYLVAISGGALEDAAGNPFAGLLTTNWTFMIIDDTPPVITCPEAFEIATDEGICAAIFPIELPSVTDNFSGSEDIQLIPTRSDGLTLEDSFPKGLTTISWIATDEAGNSSSACDQLITVNDQEYPEIMCSPNINVVGSGPEILEIVQATATDNCPEAVTISFERRDNAELSLSDAFPQGVTMIQWTAIDGNNNVATCEQTVTISMQLSMENDITGVSLEGQVGDSEIDPVEKTVKLTMPIGTDASALAPTINVSADATINPATGTPLNFELPVIYTVIAADGSQQQWEVTVEVLEDMIPPSIECPAEIVLSNDGGDCGAIVDFPDIVFSDTDSEVSLEVSIESGSFFTVGTTEVTATAMDAAGNTASCIFNVTVNDTELPELVCSGDINVSSTEENSILITVGAPEVNDNCGVQPDLIGIRDDEKGLEEPFAVGETLVTWSITDLSGNVGSCTQKVTVTPFEEPILAVTGFNLIDADNDVVIQSLMDGDEIDVATLPTMNLNIEAVVTGDVESVQMILSGEQDKTMIENFAPYALFGDAAGNFIGNVFDLGMYTITGTPYNENGLGGTAGSPVTVNFSFVTVPVDVDGDGFFNDVDCDDDNPDVNPEAVEVCDGIDNNCDGLVDEEDASVSCTEVEVQADLIDATYLMGSRNPDPTGPILRAEQGNREIYIKFDLSSLNGAITKARLEMQVASDPGNGKLEVFLGSGSNWTETGLNSSNKPVIVGSALGSISGVHKLGQTKTWNLDVSKLPATGLLTLIVKHSNGNDVAFASDETKQAPQFIITALGSTELVDVDGDGFFNDVDCDDNNPAVNPDATEICDGIDNNCDGSIDGEDPEVSCDLVETMADLIDATYLQGVNNPKPNGPILRAEEDNRVTYLKFDMGPFDDAICQAQLKMQVVSDPGNGTLEVFLGSDSNWTESGLNGRNKPTEVGISLATIMGTHSLGETKIWNLDVTQLPSNGLVTLIVKHSNGNDVAFASDESNLPPQLVLTSKGSELSDSNALRLAPNPAVVETTLSFKRPAKLVKIYLYDMLGRMVGSYECNEIEDNGGYVLNVQSIPAGTYYIKTYGDDGNIYQKQVVVKK